MNKIFFTRSFLFALGQILFHANLCKHSPLRSSLFARAASFFFIKNLFIHLPLFVFFSPLLYTAGDCMTPPKAAACSKSRIFPRSPFLLAWTPSYLPRAAVSVEAPFCSPPFHKSPGHPLTADAHPPADSGRPSFGTFIGDSPVFFIILRSTASFSCPFD